VRNRLSATTAVYSAPSGRRQNVMPVQGRRARSAQRLPLATIFRAFGACANLLTLDPKPSRASRFQKCHAGFSRMVILFSALPIQTIEHCGTAQPQPPD